MSSFNVPPSGVAGRLLNTFLNGTTDPPSYAGVNGDFWLNTTSYVLWGPKTAASGWGTSGQSLIGAAGTPEGSNRIFWGEGPPANTLGQQTNDAYFDTLNDVIYQAE